jgi:hypothetical protein
MCLHTWAVACDWSTTFLVPGVLASESQGPSRSRANEQKLWVVCESFHSMVSNPISLFTAVINSEYLLRH